MDISIINAPFRLEQRDSGVEWRNPYILYVEQLLNIYQRSLHSLRSVEMDKLTPHFDAINYIKEQIICLTITMYI